MDAGLAKMMSGAVARPVPADSAARFIQIPFAKPHFANVFILQSRAVILLRSNRSKKKR